ncbi:MAG: hypothetical protein L3K04_05500 [Thermoplasmata archaeon]|nr:hypothetical protein [Thermoplasmata archaeon]MCI4337868.1 hypothetical protein [Thermoplasmata archaeon]MCI4341164.1 hypothetical protein [Thermoplasmata archaeon]
MRESTERGGPEESIEGFESGLGEPIRLGQDLRFLLVCVGGGAARIGREILRHPPRYVESVVVNCDARVPDLEAFDRRIYLSDGSGSSNGTGGSPQVGGQLAHAAEPALERLFEGAHFVTIIASLGGGSGTGVLPYLLEAASRASSVLSLFLVKPFACEGERRAVAERAMARLHFIEPFVEKQQSQSASLEVLDNESLVAGAAGIPMSQLNRRWADRIIDHLEESFLRPAERMLESARLAQMVESEASRSPPPYGPSGGGPSGPAPPPTLPMPLLSAGLPAASAPGDAELTFEVEPPAGSGARLG